MHGGAGNSEEAFEEFDSLFDIEEAFAAPVPHGDAARRQTYLTHTLGKADHAERLHSVRPQRQPRPGLAPFMRALTDERLDALSAQGYRCDKSARPAADDKCPS